MINLSVIARILGILLSMLGGLVLICALATLCFGGSATGDLALSGVIMIGVGLLLWLVLGKKFEDAALRRREGFLIVTLGWLLMSLFGTLPYILSGSIPNFTDAFFETMSGFTTTGASVLNDIESLDQGILFWRSLTQWIGGMGIIVMTIAILPILGIGGMELFLAEAPGPSSDKLHPRIKETAKRLWLIYIGLTAVLTILLWIGEMNFFDAINHAMTTMATGGFSTRQASIGAFNSSFTHYIIVVFMFLAGTNYTLLYLSISGRVRSLIQNEEFKFYALLSVGVAILVALALCLTEEIAPSIGIRDSIFQVVSIVTTTGFVSADYTAWAPALTITFIMLMFVGGCAGSTSGGIKVVRHLTMARNCILEFRRVLHPRAIIPVKLNNRIVAPNIVTNVLVFVLIYLLIFLSSSIVMACFGLDFKSSIGSVIATLGNIGPGIGEVGPMGNFADIPAGGKWFLAFLMLVGRLELFTVLALFTRYFWRMN